MTNVKYLRTIAAALLALAVPSLALAHGGEDHGAPEPAAVSPLPVAQAPGSGADGTAFQAVLVPGAGKTVLYLADADTNAPVLRATVEAEAAGWQGQAQPTQTEGVYELVWAPPANGADVTLIVSADGRDDLILVPAVGRQAAKPEAAEPKTSLTWKSAGIAGAAGAAIVVGSLTFFRRHRRAAAIVLAIGLLSAMPAFAHSGHDHGGGGEAAPAPAAPGTPIVMPKATQFLLGIRTLKIEPQEAADTVRVVGRVVPDPLGYARVQPSQVARVVADPSFPLPVPGQEVKRGQVLAVLEPTLSTLEKGDKRASLSRVESELAIQERDLVRLETLGGLVPAKQVETARIRLDQLRKERGQIAGTALGREVLVAPVDGVVSDVHVVPGEVVTPERVVVEIVNPGLLRIEAIIHDLGTARRISSATATTKLAPDQVFSLALLGVSPRMDAQDQGVHAIFQVASEQARELSIGMPVDVFLATGQTRLRTAVPRDAIAEMGGRQMVFVRTAPEAFEARPVKVERVIGPLAEVVEGVMPGDRVVTQGIEQMRAGR